MAVLLRALRALFPVLRLQPWVLSGMMILGVLAALAEGLSISLFIPLVQDQMGTQTAGVTGRLTALFHWIPPEHRLLWIGFSIFLCMVLKNVRGSDLVPWQRQQTRTSPSECSRRLTACSSFAPLAVKVTNSDGSMRLPVR